MQTNPKVSICIPTYNNAEEVERLLQSISVQEYKDYEVNISDDSTNNAIEQLVAQYPHIHYIHNQKPYGHIFNWNKAIQMAQGEYIKIMFSDDWFTEPNSLGEFVKLLEANPKAMLAFSGSRQIMVRRNGEMQHVTKEHFISLYDRYAPTQFIEELRQDYRLLFLGNQIGAPSATIYRRGNKPALFDEKSNWASDMFLYFDLLKGNGQFAYTEAPLVSIGVHDNQYTESFSEKDMRIYNDYRYMYTKYQLKECKECREYFLEKFIIKYNQGIKEARALGIEARLYRKKLATEWKESVRCFVRHRFGNK